jgi:hypothetical protein
MILHLQFGRANYGGQIRYVSVEDSAGIRVRGLPPTRSPVTGFTTCQAFAARRLVIALQRLQHQPGHLLMRLRRGMKPRTRTGRSVAVNPAVAGIGTGAVTLTEHVDIGHAHMPGVGGADDDGFQLLSHPGEVIGIGVGQADLGAAFKPAAAPRVDTAP